MSESQANTGVLVDAQRACLACGEPLTRKQFKNSTETKERFLKRQTCDRKCAALIRKRDSEVAGIPIWKGGAVVAFAIVDLADAAPLLRHRWKLRTRYAVRKGAGGNSVSMHRELMGLDPGDERVIDHIDGDTLNNRRENLRVCTQAENQQNRRGADRNSTSRHRGVYWHGQKKKWAAVVQLDGRSNWLGLHESEDDAAEVTARFRREHMPFSKEARV